MSNLPISSKYRSQGHLPVDDREREDLVRRLNEAYAEGGVKADDYQPLLDRVFGAQTLADLVPVVEQLPAKETYNAPAIVKQNDGGPPPGELTPHRPAQRASLAVMAGAGIGIVLLVIALVILFL